MPYRKHVVLLYGIFIRAEGLIDGRQLSVPKSYFPSFENASQSDLQNYELSGNGIGIHWDSLDEDLYVPNLLMQDTSVSDEKKRA